MKLPSTVRFADEKLKEAMSPLSKYKQCQAAMEFMMTYGWAVIVVLIVIGALSYFGVLSPSKLFPEKCSFTSGIDCRDSLVADDGVSVVLHNSAGRDMKIESISFTSEALSGACSATNLDATLGNGQSETIYANDPAGCTYKETGKEKNKYNAQLILSWLDSGLSKNVNGELLARKVDGSVGSGGISGGSGIVAYWKFDEFDRVNIKDSSNKDNHGTYNGETWNDGTVNGAVLTSGKYGNGLSFDGVDDYINIPHNDAINGDAKLTYSAWFYARDYTKAHNQIIGKSVHGGGQSRAQMGIWLNSDGTIQGRAETLAGSRENVIGPVVSTNNWHNAVLVFDGTSLRLYLDGQQVASSSFSATTLAQNIDPLRIGCGYDRCGFPEPPAMAGHNYIFNGIIDEVRIYTFALTEQQVNEDMNSAFPIDRPVASYSFESGTSITLDTQNIVSGKIGPALSFDGTDDFVNVPNDADFDNLFEEGTVSAWIKLDSISTGIHQIVFSAGPRFEFAALNDDLRLGLTGNEELVAENILEADKWIHVAGVWSNVQDIHKGYVDGQLYNTFSYDKSGSIQTPFFLGSRSLVAEGELFSGIMDEVIIYNRELSGSEIAALAGQ